MGGPQGSTVKLCDFGLSAEMPDVGQLTGVHGTAPYMCPEMLESRLSDEKADVWSLGVVAYLLLCGTFPYQPRYDEWTGRKMQERIRDGGLPKCKRSWLSKSAASTLSRMLTRDPLLRPTAKESLRLPFIVDATLDNTMPKESLPCLRPVLEAAVSVGTSQRGQQKECGLDSYLNFRQVQSHGRKIPPSEPSDTPEVPKREGNWIHAQNIALSRAMACNVAEAYEKTMSDTFSDNEKLPSHVSKTSGSTCSTAAEQNQEGSEEICDIKIEF
jgi:serine/threonine protein kinase